MSDVKTDHEVSSDPLKKLDQISLCLQYVNKIIEHALDTYSQAKRNGDEIDARLERLIDRLFERNMKRRELKYVIGLALDTRRTDMILAAIKVVAALQ